MIPNNQFYLGIVNQVHRWGYHSNVSANASINSNVNADARTDVINADIDAEMLSTFVYHIVQLLLNTNQPLLDAIAIL